MLFRALYFIVVVGLIIFIVYIFIKGIKSMDTNKNNQSAKTGTKNTSVADELLKLQNLREEGIISEEEFQKMKDKLLNS